MKKTLSMLLVCVMIFACMGTTVFGAENIVAKIGEVEYESLQAAINAVGDGEIIELCSDVVLSTGISVHKSYGFTIDGNDFSISPAGAEKLGYQAIYFTGGADTVYNLNNIKFKDFVKTNVDAPLLRLEGANKFNMTNVTFENCDVDNGTYTQYSIMRIYDTDFEADNLTISNCSAGMLMDIGPSSDDFIGKIIIKNSNFVNNIVSGAALIYPTLKRAENSSLYISSTEFINNVIGDGQSDAPQGRGVIHLGSDAHIDGCMFDGNKVYGSHPNNVSYGINEYSGYNLKYSNNTFKNSAAYQTNEKLGPVAGLAMMAVGTLVLEGNVVEDNNGFYNRATSTEEYTEYPVRSVGSYSESYGMTTIISGIYNGELVTYAGDKSIEVSGGSFTDDVTEFVKDGFAIVKNADGTFGVAEDKATENFVAKIGDVEYETLADAFNSAADGNVITLLDNITVNETIISNADVTLDLNGKVITGEDNNASSSFILISVNKGTHLTVVDSVGAGEINLTAATDRDWNAMSVIFEVRGSELTVNGGVLKHLGGSDMAFVVNVNANSYGDATLNVADGVLESSYTAVRLFMDSKASNSNSGTAYLNITGGTVAGTTSAIWAQAPNSVAGQTGEINISGGNIGKVNTARSSASIVSTTVSGGTVDGFKVEAGELKITGGTITGGLEVYDVSGNAVTDAIISGGTFSSDMTGYLAEGFEIVENADGTFGVAESEEVSIWTTDSDAGFYYTGETKYGMMRFLFAADINEAAEEVGIKYINGSNISENVGDSAGNTVSKADDVKIFYGDIVNIPESITEGTYYAAAYIKTASGILWSDIVDCSISWTKQFENYQPEMGGVE